MYRAATDASDIRGEADLANETRGRIIDLLLEMGRTAAAVVIADRVVNSFQRHDSKQKPRTRLGLSPATAETATPLTVPDGRPD